MFSFCWQFCICLILGFISIIVERHCGSNTVSVFLNSNGILVLFAIFAINITSAAQLLNRFKELEERHNRPNALDKQRKTLKETFLESLLLICIFYCVMVAIPQHGWDIIKNHYYFYLALGIIARACLYQTLYVTWDLIRSSISVDMKQKVK